MVSTHSIYPVFGNTHHHFDKPTLIIGNKNYSSWSLRAWLILHGFGVNFDEMPIKLLHPSNQNILQQYTPLGKVPVLLHKSQTVWDSLAIALYAEKYLIQTNVWGNQPALAMSLMSEMHSGFMALRSEMPMNIRAKRRIIPSQQCLMDIKRFEAIVAAAMAQNQSTNKQPYLFGDFSVADVFFAPVVFRLHGYTGASGIALAQSTQDYMDTMLAHPSMQLWQNQALAETDIVPEDEAGIAVD